MPLVAARGLDGAGAADHFPGGDRRSRACAGNRRSVRNPRGWRAGVVARGGWAVPGDQRNQAVDPRPDRADPRFGALGALRRVDVTASRRSRLRGAMQSGSGRRRSGRGCGEEMHRGLMPCHAPANSDTIKVLRRRWVFSSSSQTTAASSSPSLVRSVCHAFFSLLFPSDCRICGNPLTEVTRIPVCRICLRIPKLSTSPFFCVSCRTPFQNPFPLDSAGRCGLCRNGLRGFDAGYSYGAYEGVLRDLIHLYKYGRIRTLARPLAELLRAALPRDEHWDVVAAVPLHWLRKWRRGFNQSELLARQVARSTGVPLVSALRRVRATPAQAGLSHTGRRRDTKPAPIMANAGTVGRR